MCQQNADTRLRVSMATAIASLLCRLSTIFLTLLLLPSASTFAAGDRVLRVGPERALKTPSQAAIVARDGDSIEIDAGVYVNDFTAWPQSNLILRGVGGMAHLQATRLIPNGKAIWIIQGHNTVVENIEFSGARVVDTNGAGIRHEGGDLTLRNTFFHHNEFSILSGSNAAAQIDVLRSRFWHQRRGTRWSHGIYIGAAARLTLMGNHFLDTDRGHHIKTRAEENYILYNRIEDADDSTASRAIDLPNCGLSYVVGNELHQAASAHNLNIIGYGMEGCAQRSNRHKRLYVAHNTLINNAHGGTFVWTRSGGDALVMNNLLYGPGAVLRGAGEQFNNLRQARGGQWQQRWHLPPDSPAINAATAMPPAQPSMVPTREFLPPIGTIERRLLGPLDIGSREALLIRSGAAGD
ncbi:MAG: right-handed parallel beta-helix repeat-containing protein [Halioglobus sp.]|nr:right-handed parallel beta-helix repeat-containing protein [Halioglobus sp.]